MLSRHISGRLLSRYKFSLLQNIFLLAGLQSVLAQPVPENLTEMYARRLRRATSAWAASYFEDSTTFNWQPETFMYHDTTSGHEVWKLSNTPQLITIYHPDIGFSPWNANGSKMAIHTNNRFSQAYNQTQQQEWNYLWMTVNTNGTVMRPVVEGPRRISGGYFHWSPQIPAVYYEFGETHLGTGAQPNVLYKCTVADDGIISKTPLLTYPASYGNIDKMISADGRRIIPFVGGTDTLYPSTIWPEEQAAIEVPAGYPLVQASDRAYEPYGNLTVPVDPVRFHDNYIAGDGSWYFGLFSGSSTWWRIKTTGSAPDGGPLYSGNNGSNNFGEIWPENHGALGESGSINSPFVQSNPYSPAKTCYWSHFVPDMWGRHALFSAVCDGLPKGYGPGIWDILDHHWVTPSFGGGAQHHDWHGFTDMTVSSGGPSDEATGRGATLVYAQKYNDAESQFLVNSAHTRYLGGSSYNSLARPGQSPDGTKVAWHSEFLNGTDAVDVYWSVVMYPYPPTDLQAVYSSGVRISWLPPRYTERRWINPQTGQIDETNGEILYGREIKRYHLWRSSSPDGPWQEISAGISAEYGNDPVTNTLKPRVNGNWVTPANKISYTDNPGAGTFYYALTSEEHSGLESDYLSEILRVNVSEGSLSSQVVQAKGKKDFWRTLPPPPTNLLISAENAVGHFQLNWTEPVNDKIRFYNIYYSNTAAPEKTQAFRIASIAKGTNMFLDWLGDQAVPAHYGISSVDRYGNESVLAAPGGDDVIPPAAPDNLRRQQ